MNKYFVQHHCKSIIVITISAEKENVQKVVTGEVLDTLIELMYKPCKSGGLFYHCLNRKAAKIADVLITN